VAEAGGGPCVGGAAVGGAAAVVSALRTPCAKLHAHLFGKRRRAAGGGADEDDSTLLS